LSTQIDRHHVCFYVWNFENRKIFYHYKIGNFEALNVTCCLLIKLENLETSSS
jgi:hypothetical protein